MKDENANVQQARIKTDDNDAVGDRKEALILRERAGDWWRVDGHVRS